MLADEYGDMNFYGPATLKGTSVHMHLYVENADAFFNKAVAAGARVLAPLEDRFYGDRSGSLEDPFKHVWHVASHTRDVSPEEMKKAADALSAAAEKKS